MMNIGLKKLSKIARLSGFLAKKPSKNNSDLTNMIKYEKQQSPGLPIRKLKIGAVFRPIFGNLLLKMTNKFRKLKIAQLTSFSR